MLKNWALSFISALLGIVLLEIVVGLMHLDVPGLPEKPKDDWALVPERVWTEHHPVLGWYHQKQKEAFQRVAAGHEVVLHTNSAGFRGLREYTQETPENIMRLVVLGDSFVFGFGVEDSECLTALLEAKHPDLEVINLGVAGFGVDQFLITFRTIAKDYHADYVFIGLYQEDFWRATRAFADSGHAKPYFSLNPHGELILHNVPVPQPFELKTNQFPEVVHRSFLERFLMKSSIYRILKRGYVRMAKNLRLIDPDSTEEWILGKAILRQLIHEIRTAGAQPVLFTVPHKDWAMETRVTSLERSILRFAQKEKADLLDMTPAFHEAVGKSGVTDYYIQDDWHWTPKGNALAAELIEKYLINQGVLLQETPVLA